MAFVPHVLEDPIRSTELCAVSAKKCAHCVGISQALEPPNTTTQCSSPITCVVGISPRPQVRVAIFYINLTSLHPTLQVESVPVPIGPGNPAGNAFLMQETDLLTTDTAQRDAHFPTARHWRIKNPNVLNPISKRPVGFRLLPSGSESGAFAALHSYATPTNSIKHQISTCDGR